MARTPFDTAAGAALREHHDAVKGRHLRDLLNDSGRPTAMTFRAGPLTVDFSRSLGDASTLRLLGDLATELDVPASLRRMASGERVNVTEGRAALHTALRATGERPITVDGRDVLPEVRRTADAVSAFVDAVHSGDRRSSTGEPFSDVVVIGIGGSDLGPRMAAAATRAHHTGSVSVHFVANVDPAELDTTLARLRPATTLVGVISKTFTTVETIANARAAYRWLVDAVGGPPGHGPSGHGPSGHGRSVGKSADESAVGAHLFAVTTAVDRATSFGVPADAVFGFEDWVGGRFSLASAVGIGTEFAIGSAGMAALRGGMRDVDDAVLNDDPAVNAPLLLGMLDLWYTHFWGTASKAVVPYAQDLALLPAHLQQLQMESNGKSVTEGGTPVTWATSPIVWGAPGTNGQHAFFQLLHQGTQVVPVDLIGVQAIAGSDQAHLLQANLVAQAAALALGHTEDQVRAAGTPERLVPHKVMTGNKPSTVIWLPDLSPHSVGALIALYEHATAVAGFAWGIDPFDQWGVERGKELAEGLLPAVSGTGSAADAPHGAALDAATAASLRHLTGR